MIKNETIYSDTTFVEKAMGSMFCSFLYFDFNYSEKKTKNKKTKNGIT